MWGEWGVNDTHKFPLDALGFPPHLGSMPGMVLGLNLFTLCQEAIHTIFKVKAADRCTLVRMRLLAHSVGFRL
jgi:hypothetical protein